MEDALGEPAGTPTIFVSIAAYRDIECQWTIRDLFEQAANPDAIFVGVVWQLVRGEDDDCLVIRTRERQIREVFIDAADSLGVCWARHQAQQLYRGETYTLQIDSHMRFAPGWDRELISILQACPSDRPVLSTYPSAYTPPHDLDDTTHSIVITAKEFDDAGILIFGSRTLDGVDRIDTPIPAAFVAGGYIFARAEIIGDVPYDPNIYFWGEEISLSARLWTWGWDLFHPGKVLIYHDYTGTNRTRHWSDPHPVGWDLMDARSKARVKHLFGTEPSADEEAIKDLDSYGFGTRRSLEDYEDFCGVTFRTRTIAPRARLGKFPWPQTESAQTRIFKDIYSGTGWGSLETSSGSGSTLAETRHLRGQLPGIFDILNIRSLCDAGCGDVNWLSQISGALGLYIGFDIVPGLIASNLKTFAHRKNHLFQVADILSDALPACDLLLCRDVLSHYPNDEIRQALRALKGAGCRYIAISTASAATNEEGELGGWRPVNLLAPPFNLCRPDLLIAEGAGAEDKALALWRSENFRV